MDPTRRKSLGFSCSPRDYGHSRHSPRKAPFSHFYKLGVPCVGVLNQSPTALMFGKSHIRSLVGIQLVAQCLGMRWRKQQLLGVHPMLYHLSFFGHPCVHHASISSASDSQTACQACVCPISCDTFPSNALCPLLASVLLWAMVKTTSMNLHTDPIQLYEEF